MLHKQHHARRQHIIHSLDTLLYQLHTLSFFLSPSILSYICRLVSQPQITKPRELDSTRSLRFLFSLVITFNAISVWSHARQGAAEGRAMVLDFVGVAHVPSKVQLLFLDILIIFLQMLLTSIAYETSLSNDESLDTSDNLASYSSPVPSSSFFTSDPTKRLESTYVLDLRLTPLLAHLRTPPTPSESAPLLPLPNTSSWPGLRALIRARAEIAVQQ